MLVGVKNISREDQTFKVIQLGIQKKCQAWHQNNKYFNKVRKLKSKQPTRTYTAKNTYFYFYIQAPG